MPVLQLVRHAPDPPRFRGSLLSQTKSCKTKINHHAIDRSLAQGSGPLAPKPLDCQLDGRPSVVKDVLFFVGRGGAVAWSDCEFLGTEDRLQDDLCLCVHHGMDRSKIPPWFMLHDMVNSGLVGFGFF